MKLNIEILTKDHVRKNFNCGKVSLNDYLTKQAGQDAKKELSVCYVYNDVDENRIIGYYTLSSNSILRSDFPEELLKRIPNYNDMPTALIGRLAIDERDKGNGYGEILLFDALKRCLDISKIIGTFAVIVEPIDDDAKRFYENYGFILIPSNNKMFITIKTIEDSYS